MGAYYQVNPVVHCIMLFDVQLAKISSSYKLLSPKFRQTFRAIIPESVNDDLKHCNSIRWLLESDAIKKG